MLGPSQAAEDVLDRVGALTRSGPGLGAILVVGQMTPQLLRHALRAGIDDAIELAHAETQLTPAVVELLYRLENELSTAGARDASARQAEGSWVTSVFSPKGGVGKSVVVLDLDLQFGDIGVMLRLQPVHTVSDAVSAGPLLDESLFRSFLACHERSGVHVLAAPTSPSEGDQVSADSMLHVLGLLREMFGHVVIDTPPHLSEVVLQALAVSDTVAFMVAMDVPSVKNARLGLQAFELLQLPDERLLLVLNRADSHVHLAVRDVERALERKVDLTLPSEALVPQSVNHGIPAVLEYPRSRFAGQVNQLADFVLARCRNGERVEGSIR